MRLFIASEHDTGETKATGPLHSIIEAEKMLDRIAKVRDVIRADVWSVNDEGEPVGGRLMWYERK
jgi:hypothetical protein